VDIYINESKIDAEVEATGTVKELVTVLQHRYCPAGQLVVAVRCDGGDVNPGAMEQTLSRPVSEVARLDVYTSSREVLVHDAMAQASATLQDTENACQRVAELIHEGQSKEGIELLGQCLYIWQQIHDAVGKSIVMLGLDMENMTIRDEPLIKIISMPKETLLQVKGALEAQDHVLLADILQYEFTEVTERWHALIAMLRNEAEERLQETPSS